MRRHAELDLNCGLVVGDGACLVVDTRSHLGEAADLIAAVRTVTPHPWTVVNTHAHYDHCFGNAAFRPAPIWGSRGCAADLAATGEHQRRRRRRGSCATRATTGRRTWWRRPRSTRRTTWSTTSPCSTSAAARWRCASSAAATPTRDLVVEVEDDGDGTVVFAGDLVEEGAPPAFDDAFPAEWPATLGRLHALARGPVVPGHGAVVDAAFVGAQREELLAVLTALRTGRPQDGPYDEATMRTAAGRLAPDADFPRGKSRGVR